MFRSIDQVSCAERQDSSDDLSHDIPVRAASFLHLHFLSAVLESIL